LQLSMCSEMTECFDSSNLMLLRCSLTLVLNCLFVCILCMRRHKPCSEFCKPCSFYVCVFLCLCTLTNLLILFKLLKPTLRLDLLIKEVVISEMLRKNIIYRITKYFFVSCMSLPFFLELLFYLYLKIICY